MGTGKSVAVMAVAQGFRVVVPGEGEYGWASWQFEPHGWEELVGSGGGPLGHLQDCRGSARDMYAAG